MIALLSKAMPMLASVVFTCWASDVDTHRGSYRADFIELHIDGCRRVYQQFDIADRDVGKPLCLRLQNIASPVGLAATHSVRSNRKPSRVLPGFLSIEG